MNNSAPNNDSGDSPQPNKPNKEVGVYKGFAFTSVASVINIIALFAESIIAIRLLSKVDWGIYVLLITVTNFIMMATDFGFKISITQFIASGNKEQQAVLTNSVLSLRVIICLLMSVAVWFGRDLLNWIDPSGGVLLYATLIPAMYVVGSIEQLLSGMLKGFKRYDHAAIGQALRSVARVVLTVVLLLVFDLGILALIYSWIISFAITSIYLYMQLPVPKRWRLHAPSLREIVRFGAPIQASAFLWYVSWQLHIVLLSTLAGPAYVALFDVANRIPAALNRFSDSYVSIFFPTMSSLLAENKREKATWMLNQSLRLSAFVLGIGVLFAVLFSREIMGILFSSEYAETASAFSLLMVSFHMTFMVHLLGYTLTSAGYPEKSLVENSVRTAISTALGLLLIPTFRYFGAAIGQLVSNYAANPVAVYLLRQVDIRVQIAPYAKQTALLIAFCIAGWFVGGMELELMPSIAYRLLMLVGFIAGSFLLSIVSLDDLQIVLPKSVQAKLGIQKAEVSPAA